MPSIKWKWLRDASIEYFAPLRDYSSVTSVVFYFLALCGIGASVFFPISWEIRLVIVSAIWVVLGIAAVYRLTTSRYGSRQGVVRGLAELSMLASSTASAHRSVQIHEEHLADLDKLRAELIEELPHLREAVERWFAARQAEWEEGRPSVPTEDSTTIYPLLLDAVEMLLGRAALPKLLSLPETHGEVERLKSYSAALAALSDEVRTGAWDDEFSKEARSGRKEASERFVDRLIARLERAVQRSGFVAPPGSARDLRRRRDPARETVPERPGRQHAQHPARAVGQEVEEERVPAGEDQLRGLDEQRDPHDRGDAP